MVAADVGHMWSNIEGEAVIMGHKYNSGGFGSGIVIKRDERMGIYFLHRERDREDDILGAGKTLNTVIIVAL